MGSGGAGDGYVWGGLELCMKLPKERERYGSLAICLPVGVLLVEATWAAGALSWIGVEGPGLAASSGL
jgi:hypothetical protein